MRRITIIGNAGGGKSTLAVRLAEILDLPHCPLDHIQWQAGWTPTPAGEFDRQHRELLQRERWVIDGFGGMADIEERLNAADTVVFIDRPLWRHYWWAIKRQIKALFRPDPHAPQGCSLLAVTWPLLRMMWDIHRDDRPKVANLLETLGSDTRVVTLRSPDAMEAYVRNARAQRAAEAAS